MLHNMHSDNLVLFLPSNLARNGNMPDDWRGDLDITYGLGPGFVNGYEDM